MWCWPPIEVITMKCFRVWSFLLGIVTCIPLLYFILLLCLMIVDLTTGTGTWALFLGRNILLFFGIHDFMILLSIILVVFYVFYLYRTDRVPKDRKTLWAILLIFGGLVCLPIFWFLYFNQKRVSD